VYYWSVDHPAHPVDRKKVVETRVVLGAYGFVPTSTGSTLAHRILLVDPAGNIPAWAVEMNTSLFPLYLTDWRQHLEAKEESKC